MKKSILLGLLVCILFLGLNSCSKEEISQETQQKEVGTLSFGSFLNGFSNRGYLNKTSTDSYDIPQCSEETPLFVFISLKLFNGTDWEWYKDSNNQKIMIEVNPNGTDLDGDGVKDAWFTNESADLELVEGKYRLEYFAVASSEDPDDIIYMAPRIPEDNLDYDQSIQYHNFVDKPLPIEVAIPAGAKYYQPVEVLCYEEHFAFAFGYLFFDFNSNNLIYFCTYGNVCDEDGRHMPAQFKIKVWKDANETELLVIAQNERKSFSDESGTHFYTEGLCFPLPELEENDEYFAKIWLVDETSETLIREGSFGAEDLVQIYKEEQKHYYYHFREACCGEATDNYPLLEDLTDNEGECEEPQEPQDPECNPCEGKVTKLTIEYLGEDDTQVTVQQSKTGNEHMEIFDGVLDRGETFTIEGQFKKGGEVLSLWTEIYLQENGGETTQIHTSCSQPIGPGYIYGNFKIISGESAEGGLLCPAPQ